MQADHIHPGDDVIDPFRAGMGPRAEQVVAYFFAYLASLFFTLENEWTHWLTLVSVPLVAVWWVSRRRDRSLPLREVARGLGLHLPEGGRGMVLALGLAVGFQGIQLLNGPQRSELLQILATGRALWIVPAALLLVTATAGFTEEFFFRGVLQRALTARLGSWPGAVVLTSVAFSLFHFPYAYLDPDWPSAGDLVQAGLSSLTTGTMGGLALGLVFVRARGSLVPGVLVHSCINWIPAIRLLANQ